MLMLHHHERMAKSFERIGAWAEEAEREEAERKDLEAKEATLAVNRQKKKKSSTFPLSVLTRGQYVGPGERSRHVNDAKNFASENRNRPLARPEEHPQVAGSKPFDRARLPERATRERDIPSRADQVDDWGSTKRFVASAARENPDRRRPAFESPSSLAETNANANDSNNYGRELPRPQPRVRSDPFAGARPREEVLAEKRGESLELNAAKDGKDAIGSTDKDKYVRPSSSSSSSRSGRPPTPDVKGSRGADVEPRAVVHRQKVNPFGDAKPREVLLEEKGLDWRKMDMELEHRPVVRMESEEEKELKEEIRALEELIKNTNDGDGGEAVDRTAQRLDTEKIGNLQAQLTQKESELQELILAFDDKVRFAQKAVDRPGSRSGHLDSNKGSGYSTRLGSGSERLEITRGYTSERQVPLPGRGDLRREYDGERPTFSPRDANVSWGFDMERWASLTGHGGMVRGYECLDDRGLYFDRPVSRSGPGDLSGGYDINRLGYHSGHGDFAIGHESDFSASHAGISDCLQGNGSERLSPQLGHIGVTRGCNLERLDFHSRPSNIVRGGDFERPGLGSRRGDVRGYESERSGSGSGSWHNDSGACVSARPGSGSWRNDGRVLESLRPGSDSGHSDGICDFGLDRRSGRANLARGHDVEAPGTYAHHTEAPKSYGVERLGFQSAGYRNFGKLYDSERPDIKPRNVDAYRGFDERFAHFGNEEAGGVYYEPGRSHAPYEPGRMGPWLGRVGSRSSHEPFKDLKARSNDDLVFDKMGSYGEQDFKRRGIYGKRDYNRRSTKFDQNRAISVYR